MSTSQWAHPVGDRTAARPILRPMPVWAGITIGTLLGFGAMLLQFEAVVYEGSYAPQTSTVLRPDADGSGGPDDVLLWGAVVVAVLTFALVPLSARLLGAGAAAGARTSSGDAAPAAAVDAGAHVAAVQVLRAARTVLFLVSVVAFTQLPARALAFVFAPEHGSSDDVVGLLLLGTLVVVLHGFDRATAPWTVAAVEEAALVEAITARATATDARDHSQRAARQRTLLIRSYAVPALVVLVLVVAGFVSIVVVARGDGGTIPASFLADIVRGAVFFPTLTLALVAMLKRTLRTIAERRLGRRDGWDGWFAALLFVTLLSVAIWNIATSSSAGAQGALAALLVFGSPFLAAIIGALVFREWRVQEESALDRLRDGDQATPRAAIGIPRAHAADPDRATPVPDATVGRDGPDGSAHALAPEPVTGFATASIPAPRPAPAPAAVPVRERGTAALGVVGALAGAVGIVLGIVGLVRSAGRRHRS